MTWWSWILIWVGLALGAVAVLVLFALSYWRKGKLLLGQLSEVTAKLETLSPGMTEDLPSRPPSSLFADRALVRRAHEGRRDARRDRIDLRRSGRVERGKLLVHRNRQVK
ncbi:hypothetical protein C5C31_04135 [Rathayibacter rathayi]|uniref:DUF948 domain-containing protein n=1 Tax=Rathayibacter rathayi TaxID=33887 RepID=A0ABD6W6H3_RATRA|nr:hypothetical protein [Rathayibacter rathayi]AZZ48778.1 hypothetical protein C1O28_05890 [Rathayibacter rathayi]MWV73866.1 hypothetical protein [Rathayibacter rathayi NCPPB 2980 = VKM Ac-1601]PPF11320.1 hypothetical protein C5C04_12275 [Rathayibacter rathayi]PPF25385.1 hypothetical protein C5C34_03205 [Rathayibacter rathayi]PPF50777.1 hypothetical protein C5C08_03940 [Rathayibacter rathayi]